MRKILLIAGALGLILLALGLWIVHLPLRTAEAQSQVPVLTGRVRDLLGRPVPEAAVRLLDAGDGRLLEEAHTQEDGRFALAVPSPLPEGVILEVERRHFQPLRQPLSPEELRRLQAGESLALADVVLERRWGPAFWLATLVFLGMLGAIATERLHTALAGLAAMSLLLGFSILGSFLGSEWVVFDFETAIRYVDWEVIFLILGMMIYIAVIERTGFFQWLAFAAFRLSRGRAWLLLPILMVFTGVASAFLDNVTTMLLISPITIEVALVMGLNPLALLIPEVLASNVSGISTLVGTPTNILIGSYGGISFGQFLQNQTPGVVVSLFALILYSELIYWPDLRQGSREVSPVLLAKLQEHARISRPTELRRAGWVGLGMLVLFLVGGPLHVPPAVTALLGASALMLWVQPDVEEMIEAVDWTTLVFFMSLFVVIGGVREVGLISFLADLLGRIVGTHLLAAMLVVTWASAFLSAAIDNIPFTAAMLPVVEHLTGRIPGAESKVLYYSLSVGAAMGGNGSLIGASPNLITAGIAERAGYPITYRYFLKKGLPSMILTVLLAFIWLWIRFG